MPPAAFLAADGKMNIYLVVLAGTVGSYLGSAITYWISRIWGTPADHEVWQIFLLPA